MAEKVESLNFKIQATDEASAVFKKFHENAKSSLLESIKGTFGRGSTLDESLKAAGGAGPLIGFTAIAETIGKFSEKMIEVRDLMNQSGVGAGEIAVKLGEGLPIIGGFITAGQSVRELITGEKYDIDAMNRSVQATNYFMDAQAGFIKAARDEQVKFNEEIRKLKDESSLIGLSGPSRGIAAQQNANQLLRDKLKTQGDTYGLPSELQNKIDEARNNADLKKANDALRAIQAEKAPISMAGANASIDRFLGLNASADREEKKAARSPRGAEYIARETAAAKEVQKLREEESAKELQIKTDYYKTLGLTLQAGEAMETELRRQAGLEREALILQQEIKIEDIQARGREAALRNAGQGYAADLDALKQSFADQNAAIDAELKKHLDEIAHGDVGKDQDETNANRARDTAKAKDQAEREKSGNKRLYNEQIAAAQYQNSLRLQSIDDMIARNRLSAMQDYVAAGNKSLAIFMEEQQITDQIRTRREEIVKLMREATDLQKAALQAQLDALPAEEKRLQQRKRDEVLQSGAHAALEAFAPNNRQARIALAQLDIENKFRDQRQALEGIGKDKNASAAEKDHANILLGGLGDAEQREMRRAALAGIEYNPFAQGVDNRGGQHGIAQAAQERAFFQQHQADDPQKEVPMLLKDIKVLMAQIAKNTADDPSNSLFGGN